MDFDFPYIYKRAALLKIDLPQGVPGLSYWTKKYTTYPHCDLLKCLNGWQSHSHKGMSTLDYIGKVFLGAGKTQRDYNTYLDLIKAGEGEKIGLDNLCDVEITYNLYQRLAPYLF
jgi:DNA polymerase elongation subunit (family B)